MWEYLEYLLRIVLAGILGAVIGYERIRRGKEAGIRTHIIVAMASALMMVISKYGFEDLYSNPKVSVDPTRIASQIITGIGFLGAGMIFVQRKTIKGLTTAAGVWATAGIGMAIGAGMYLIGGSTAVLIIIIQFIMHKNWRFLQQPNETFIYITLVDSQEAISYLKNYFSSLNILVENMSVKKGQNGTLEIEIEAVLPNKFELVDLLNYDTNYIISLTV
jgi:putative Mg2+ transporter-C (MgtC) family protein